MNNIETKQIIKLYPLKDRIYVFLRMLILPIEKIEKYVPKKGKILDVGCGYGISSIYLALKSGQRKIIGLELNKKRVKTVRKAAKRIDNLDFEIKDLTKQGHIGRDKVEGIVMVDILHHIDHKSQERLLNKSFLSLKKKGKLIIKDIDKKPEFKYYWNLMHDKIMTCFEKTYYFEAHRMKRKLEKTGFQVRMIKLKSLFYPHVLFIAEKP